MKSILKYQPMLSNTITVILLVSAFIGILLNLKGTFLCILLAAFSNYQAVKFKNKSKNINNNG